MTRWQNTTRLYCFRKNKNRDNRLGKRMMTKEKMIFRTASSFIYTNLDTIQYNCY